MAVGDAAGLAKPTTGGGIYYSLLSGRYAAEVLTSALRSDRTGGSVPNSFDRTLLRLRPFQEYLAAGWTHLGTPDDVREGLERYVETTGIRRMLLLMALPGIPTDLALRSMRMFAEEVGPRLASATARAVSGA